MYSGSFERSFEVAVPARWAAARLMPLNLSSISALFYHAIGGYNSIIDLLFFLYYVIIMFMVLTSEPEKLHYIHRDLELPQGMLDRILVTAQPLVKRVIDHSQPNIATTELVTNLNGTQGMPLSYRKILGKGYDTLKLRSPEDVENKEDPQLNLELSAKNKRTVLSSIGNFGGLAIQTWFDVLRSDSDPRDASQTMQCDEVLLALEGLSDITDFGKLLQDNPEMPYLAMIDNLAGIMLRQHTDVTIEQAYTSKDISLPIHPEKITVEGNGLPGNVPRAALEAYLGARLIVRTTADRSDNQREAYRITATAPFDIIDPQTGNEGRVWKQYQYNFPLNQQDRVPSASMSMMSVEFDRRTLKRYSDFAWRHDNHRTAALSALESVYNEHVLGVERP